MGTNIRIGQGYDVHCLVKGRELWLGGVKFDFDRGLLGHSDADVLTHAACDALLGAAGQGDIGRHFPDNDDRWRGASGEKIATETMRIVKEAGFCLLNIDCTVICQQPKILPQVEQIKKNFSNWFDVELSAINIKGTSTEEMGFTGRGEGIAALAVALLEKR